jgi:hypothetical protein
MLANCSTNHTSKFLGFGLEVVRNIREWVERKRTAANIIHSPPINSIKIKNL